MQSDHLLKNIPADLPGELFQTVLETDAFRVQRIISLGHCSKDDFWYDQQEAEWVAVIQGEAELEFEGESEPIRMTPGSFINIPAHRRHRVRWTTPAEPTVWLAIYYRDKASS